MTTRNEHWNTIFSAKADPELGWYEEDVSQTLKFLDPILPTQSITIFLPGAGTSVLVDELMTRGHRLILNDVSDEALHKLRKRIGANSGLTWLDHDISKPLPDNLPPADIWVDRAVLHFLVEEADIQGYFANLQTALCHGGHALLAESSIRGARTCAGLELHRYSIGEMTERIGKSFELVRNEEYTYINPLGEPRPYIYALYRKTNR
jgi:hypothetical protein